MGEARRRMVFDGAGPKRNGSARSFRAFRRFFRQAACSRLRRVSGAGRTISEASASTDGGGHVGALHRCVSAQVFASDTHISYHINDGKSLEMVQHDDSTDFVFSFDSLVHAEADAY